MAEPPSPKPDAPGNGRTVSFPKIGETGKASPMRNAPRGRQAAPAEPAWEPAAEAGGPADAPVSFERMGASADGGDEGGPRVSFEHVCCQAVRPNPFDPEVDVQGEEPRKEPYLVDASVIRPSAGIGVVLLLMGLAGGAALASSLVWESAIGTLTGATVAGLLFAYMLVSLLMMKVGADQIQVEATRHILDPVVERGKTFQVALDTQASFAPGRLRVEVTDMHSPGLRPVQPPRMEGFGRIEYMVRAQGRGLLTFKGIELRVRSSDGLWAQDREYRFRTTIEVSASIPAIAFRAYLGSAASMPANMPSAIVKLYRDVENEVIKPFGPGDRLRDVDWKRAAISGQMVTRQRSQEGEQTILLTVDCGRSMMQDQKGFRNLDLALEYAQEFMEAGLRRNHEVGMLAFNENEILDHVRPTRKKIQGRRLSLHLRNAAGHHLPEDGDEPVETTVIGNPENLLIGMQHGIRQRSTQILTVILFTDLRTTPEEIAQGLSRAATSGHRVVVMLLPPPKLKPVLPEVEEDEAEEEEELRGEEHTLRLRELMMGHGVQFLEINPSEDDLKLEFPEPGAPPPPPPKPPVKTGPGAPYRRPPPSPPASPSSPAPRKP